MRLKTIERFPTFPYDLVLCTIDLVGVYPNRPREEALIAINKTLDTKQFQQTLSWSEELGRILVET